MNIRYLLVLPAVAVLVAAPVLATAQESEDVNAWSGWRAGIELGINHNAYDGFQSSNAFEQTLEFGYDYRINYQLVVGGDVYGDWSSNTSHAVNSSPGSNADFGSRGYGVDGLLGFPVNNFMPYVKLGYGQVSLTGDWSGSDTGIRYGAGLIWRLDVHSGLLVQFTYQKVSIPGNPGNPGNGDFKNTNLTVGYNWFFY